jgi:chromosomal replication initiation ATPase DnaA
MPEKEEIITLLKNIQNGIKKYSIKGLNEAIETAMDSIDTNQKDKQKQVSIIINTVCNDFDITRTQLVHSRARGNIQQAKMMAYCLLHYQLGLTIRHIAKKVFNREHHYCVTSAIRHYKNLNLNIKPDKEFNDRYEKIKSVAISKLINKKQEV